MELSGNTWKEEQEHGSVKYNEDESVWIKQ